MNRGRLKRPLPSTSSPEQEFFFTYGRTCGDIDISATLDFTGVHGKAATLTAAGSTRPASAALDIAAGASPRVSRRSPRAMGLSSTVASSSSRPGFLDYIADDTTIWEQEPLMESRGTTASSWPMNITGSGNRWITLRDKHLLENYGGTGKAPWKNLGLSSQ